jgi:hypothetical protein
MRIQPLGTAPLASPNLNSPRPLLKVANNSEAQRQREGIKLTLSNDLVGHVWEKQDKETKTVMTQLSRHYDEMMRNLLPKGEASGYLMSPQQLMMQEFFGKHIAGVLDKLRLKNEQKPAQLTIDPNVSLATQLEVLESNPKKLIQVKSPVLELPIKQLNTREFKVEALKVKPSGMVRDIETQAKVDYSFEESLREKFGNLLESGHLRIDY